jgi:PAS domain S-box-containing protein
MDTNLNRGGFASDRSRTILVVEDSLSYRKLLRDYLSQDNRYTYKILETETGAEGLKQYRTVQPDAILLDYILPDMNGLEFLHALQQQIKKPDLPVVLMTRYEDENLEAQAIESGAQQYLNKSQLTTENLRLSLHNAIKQGELLREVAALKQENQQHLRVLKEQEEQLRLALSSAQMGIWDWNLLTGQVHWNREHEELFNLAPGSFDGSYEAFDRCIHPEDRETVHNAVVQTIENRAILCHQFRIIWDNASIHWIETRGEAYFNDAGQAVRMIGTVLNIDDRHQAQQIQADLFAQAQLELTQRKQAEMTLQLLNAELAQRQAVEKLKDEFIGIVSHELRTPLTSMQGSLGLLAMGIMDDEPAQMKRMIEIASLETERLVRMVDYILDLEKLEADSHMLEQKWCDALSLIQNAIDVMSNSADSATVRLELDCPSVEIWVAPDLMIQVFTNLFSNAIKFSPDGGIVSIEATVIDRSICPALSTTFQQVNITVRDRGRGIPADKLETIFNRFQQVDASDSRDKGGTGLGLAICKSIVEQHHGSIWAESIWGQGSTFFLSLPQPMKENPSDKGTLRK